MSRSGRRPTIYVLACISVTFGAAVVITIGFCHSFDRPYEGFRRAAGVRDVPEGEPLACALAIADTVSGPEMRPRCLATVAVAYAKTGEIDTALTIGDSIECPGERVRIQIAAGFSAAEAGNTSRACRLFEAVLAALRHFDRDAFAVAGGDTVLGDIAICCAEVGFYRPCVRRDRDRQGCPPADGVGNPSVRSVRGVRPSWVRGPA